MAIILTEPEVQDLVNANSIVQDGIKNALNITDDVIFISEDEYINGINADFTLVQDDTIKAIIECKSGSINVTEYVRGIGQLLQYEYFGEESIPHKSYKYESEPDFKTIYLFPSSVIKNNQFNIAKFKYPETTMILELNEYNHAIRHIDESEMNKLKVDDEDNLTSISPYYFRDNRIFEYYILLHYLFLQENIGIEKIDRAETEENFLIKTKTINNGNWRNAFITLSNLGFINNRNLLTEAGKEAIIQDYESFAVNMFHSYLEPYFREILISFDDKIDIKISNAEISNKIRQRFSNRDVLYLTQSNNRYISSWLNIMRDDYGIIDFKSRSKNRHINYNPFELNDIGLKSKIREYSVAKAYIKRYQEILHGEF